MPLALEAVTLLTPAALILSAIWPAYPALVVALTTNSFNAVILVAGVGAIVGVGVFVGALATGVGETDAVDEGVSLFLLVKVKMPIPTPMPTATVAQKTARVMTIILNIE